MNESINTENQKHSHQKPPRSLGRIACEILAGAATGAALAYSSLYVVGYGAKSAGWGGGQMDGLAVLAILFCVVPPVYVVGCAVGVYLVGRVGNQTGSLQTTLGASLLGIFVMAILYIYAKEAEDMMWTIEKIILWPLVFLVVPGIATLGFNLTRRYKDQTSRRSTTLKSVCPRLTSFHRIILSAFLLIACLIVWVCVIEFPTKQVKSKSDRIRSGAATPAELIEGLKSPDSRVRSAAANALGRIKEESVVKELIVCLGEENSPYVRSIVAHILAKIADPRAMGSLVKALEDEEYMVRRWAAVGLKAIGDTSCIPALEKLAETDTKNRDSVERAIKAIKKREGSEK